MLRQAETVEAHSKEILVQPNKVLDENPNDVEDFPIFVGGNAQVTDARLWTRNRPVANNATRTTDLVYQIDGCNATLNEENFNSCSQNSLKVLGS